MLRIRAFFQQELTGIQFLHLSWAPLPLMARSSTSFSRKIALLRLLAIFSNYIRAPVKLASGIFKNLIGNVWDFVFYLDLYFLKYGNAKLDRTIAP